jgi:predicted RNA polymerase sigma factor
MGAVPETFALLALMHLHAARLWARRDATGGLLLLEVRDRSRWIRTVAQPISLACVAHVHVLTNGWSAIVGLESIGPFTKSSPQDAV